MAVCKTIRTKDGIKEFLIQSENGDENITAFKYKDQKVEVHSLKVECSPLSLDENTCINLISDDSFGSLLVGVTPKQDSTFIEIRVWDVAGTQGFLQKDLLCKGDPRKENKQRYSYSFQNIFKENICSVITASMGTMVCLILNGKVCVLFKFRLTDSGGISFEFKSSISLNEATPVSQAMFLRTQDKTYLALVENTVINMFEVDGDNLKSCYTINVPMRSTQATTISRLFKITSSKCLVLDNVGHVFLLGVPDHLSPLKLPSSINGHSVCSVVGFKHTSEGILAICNNDYTVNFYSLADILCSVTNGVSIYVKPYRAFCSQFPINAISFIKSDQLAMVSAVNQSITFLGGLSKGHWMKK